MKARRQLTDKQQNFILAYLKNGFNGYQAMLTAGYTHDVLLNKYSSFYFSYEHTPDITHEFSIKIDIRGVI